MNFLSPCFNYFFPSRHNIYLALVFFIPPRLNDKYACFLLLTLLVCVFFSFNLILPFKNLSSDYELIWDFPSYFSAHITTAPLWQFLVSKFTDILM